MKYSEESHNSVVTLFSVTVSCILSFIIFCFYVIDLHYVFVLCLCKVMKGPHFYIKCIEGLYKINLVGSQSKGIEAVLASYAFSTDKICLFGLKQNGCINITMAIEG